ncbi:MAG TPA: prepilin-type N-terminal cleavage/methylation domain-containing protein [Opitutaceae bacterium]|jgi:hypothetical protein|nr:prepilin-type N-terminal cleavage/methylation domain-containing protein [Opitutaceae bacterium]
MAYPTYFTPDHIDRAGTRAFTLVELMVAIGIGTFVLSGVLTTYVMIGRSEASAGNYCDLDYNARMGLENFGREVRSADGITAYAATSVTLTVPGPGPSGALTIPNTSASSSSTNQYYTVKYELISDPDTADYPGLYALHRNGPPLASPFKSDGTVAASIDTYPIRGVPQSSTIFKYFSKQAGYINGPGYGPGNTTPTNEIDPTTSPQTLSTSIYQVELTLTAQRSRSTLVTATNTVLSACFTIRNN